MAFSVNTTGIDPQLSDPENGDYSLLPGSPAAGFGCQTFPEGRVIEITDTEYNQIITKTSREVQEAGGTITLDTIWDADTVRVIDNIHIDTDATLTIAAGTKVEFQGYYNIDVKGRIIANGLPDQPIEFTYFDPHDFAFDNSPFGCWGGFIYNDTPAANRSEFSYCTFNYAKGLDENMFGSIFNLYNFSNLQVENSVFQYNLAEYGGVFGLNYFSNPQLISNLFINNNALTGGSVFYITYSHPVIANNTIIQNNVINDDITYPTAAIETYMSKPKLFNNILWDNWTNFYTNHQLFNCKPYYVFHNLILDGYDGVNNLDSDPLFETINSGTLSGQSPCIDAGTFEQYGITFPDYDLLGNARVYGSQIDLGAFEYSQETSVDEHEAPVISSSISCYPNPFVTQHHRGDITIILNDDSDSFATICIYDLRGRKIRDITIAETNRANTYKWSVEESGKIQTGIYLIKATTSKNNSYASKILILH